MRPSARFLSLILAAALSLTLAACAAAQEGVGPREGPGFDGIRQEQGDRGDKADNKKRGGRPPGGQKGAST